MEKKLIRKEIAARRKAADPEQLERYSRQICGKIQQLQQYQESEWIYAYMDFNKEVMTRELIREAWEQKKRVAVPRVEGKEMTFYEITDFEQLVESNYGILEPDPQKMEKASSETALMIVPGVAFDRARHRVGYGGGYYDRYLSNHRKHTTVAVAFEFQVLDAVPVEENDRLPDCLITEENQYESRDFMLENIGKKAVEAKPFLQKMTPDQKNEALRKVAEDLVAHSDDLIAENKKDMEYGRNRGMNAGLLDRLELNQTRIEQMAEGLRQLADMEDPIGEVLGMKKRPNGLLIGQKRVPLGVVGIIYEARPNVTADAFGLCFKTGNAVILKGGSDAIHSNQAIVSCIQRSLQESGIPEYAIQLIADTSRETAAAFMKMNQYVDVLIPRGGAGLIRATVENSTIPVIETGTGNCHIYVDDSADLEMAQQIIINAKTQRVGVCNACESLVVHRSMLEKLLPALGKKLQEHGVEIRADERALPYLEGAIAADDSDWGTEYLDYKISVKTVDSLEEAIVHINRYNTGHSESILTNNYTHAQRFLDEIDAAAVYVNASTRFTDGGEFGFGAEIGISTQKLHARGPMGLSALTTTKYIIYGNGQIRK